MARVESFDDTTWAGVVAAALVAQARPGARICLATGRTPAPVFEVVAKHSALDGMTILLLDEFGGLPAGDPGRCVSMIRRDLLDRCRGRPRLLAPDVDTPDPIEAARHYGALVAKGGIDLAVVGLGANGHVGMNEPGSNADLPTRVVGLSPATAEGAARYGATTAPTWGITVGLAELMEAGEVWVLVTGRHKRAILDATLEGPVGPELPASFLTAHHNAVFFTDHSALGRS